MCKCLEMWTTFTHKHMHAAINPNTHTCSRSSCLHACGSNLPCVITLTPSHTHTHAHTCTHTHSYACMSICMQQHTYKYVLLTFKKHYHIYATTMVDVHTPMFMQTTMFSRTAWQSAHLFYRGSCLSHSFIWPLSIPALTA